MQKPNNRSALLILADGTTFQGFAAGKKGITTGEICFNTGMTGYQEVFTDPSYHGQLMVTTNVHIGNYGVKSEETESGTIQIAGLICKTLNDHYSRSMADSNIEDYFLTNDIVVIHGLDTRALVRHIRDKGAMNAIISTDGSSAESLKEILSKAPSMDGLELASKVSTKESYHYGKEDSKYKVAVLDFGTKKNILRCFADRDCFLKVFPATATFDEISKWKPDGYFLSNGPGDPAAMQYAIDTIKDILKTNKPTFGICLGHQLLALSMGISTYKMHHGHRGINHPVKNILTGKCEITSQNHGFGVKKEAIMEMADKIEVTHLNLNDDTIEGIKIKGSPAFSIQFHPESSPGPHDSRYLFDQFVSMLKEYKSQQN